MRSWIRPRAARIRSSAAICSSVGGRNTGVLLQQTQHLFLATLQHADELFVGRAARLPAFHYVIPCASAIFEQPVFGFGIEMRGEWAVDHIFLLCFIVVRRNFEVQFLAQGYCARYGCLPQYPCARNCTSKFRRTTMKHSQNM